MKFSTSLEQENISFSTEAEPLLRISELSENQRAWRNTFIKL